MCARNSEHSLKKYLLLQIFFVCLECAKQQLGSNKERAYMEAFKGKKPKVDDLVRFIEESSMGTFISHATIENITGVNRKTHPEFMSSIIATVRSKLLSTRNHTPTRFLSSKKGEGYIVTTPEDFVSQGQKWKRKSNNAIRKSLKIVSTGMQYLPELSTVEQHKLLTERAKVGCLTILFKNVESKETKKVLENTICKKLTDSDVIKYLLNRATKDEQNEDRSESETV